MDKVPTVHIPMKTEAVREALGSSYYMIQTKIDPGRYCPSLYSPTNLT